MIFELCKVFPHYSRKGKKDPGLKSGETGARAPYYSILYTVYYTTQYYIIQYYTVLYYSILYCAMFYNTIQWYTVIYYTVQYYTAP